MKDLLVIDFDDTIYFENESVDEVYLKLKKLSNDFEIIISTKREVSSFFELIDKKIIDKYVKAFSFNSGCTVMIKDDIYDIYIDKNIFNDFINKIYRKDSFIITTKSGKRYDIDYYINKEKKDEIFEIDYYGKDFIYLAKIIDYCSCNNLSVLLDINSKSTNFCLKIFPKNINKLSVLNYIQTEYKKVYAIGDSFIDLPFILTNGVVGYINGISNIKEINDFKLLELVKYIFKI